MTNVTSEHALAALRQILIRALDAVTKESPLAGWEAQFAAMERGKQADWLLQLFSVLMSDVLAQGPEGAQRGDRL